MLPKSKGILQCPILDQLFYRLFQRIDVYLTVKWCITKNIYKLGLTFMTILNI